MSRPQLQFDPHSPQGQLLVTLFAVLLGMRQRSGNINGGDVVDLLGELFEKVGLGDLDTATMPPGVPMINLTGDKAVLLLGDTELAWTVPYRVWLGQDVDEVEVMTTDPVHEWVCPCGNTWEHGLYPSDRHGNAVDPTDPAWIDDNAICTCRNCGRVVHGASGVVLSAPTKNPPPHPAP